MTGAYGQSRAKGSHLTLVHSLRLSVSARDFSKLTLEHSGQVPNIRRISTTKTTSPATAGLGLGALSKKETGLVRENLVSAPGLIEGPCYDV